MCNVSKKQKQTLTWLCYFWNTSFELVKSQSNKKVIQDKGFNIMNITNNITNIMHLHLQGLVSDVYCVGEFGTAFKGKFSNTVFLKTSI